MNLHLSSVVGVFDFDKTWNRAFDSSKFYRELKLRGTYFDEKMLAVFNSLHGYFRRNYSRGQARNVT